MVVEKINPNVSYICCFILVKVEQDVFYVYSRSRLYLDLHQIVASAIAKAWNF